MRKHHVREKNLAADCEEQLFVCGMPYTIGVMSLVFHFSDGGRVQGWKNTHSGYWLAFDLPHFGT